MTYIIRPITEQDISQTAELYRTSMTAAPYFREISPELAVRQIKNDMAATLLVAEIEGEIVGMTTAFQVFDNAWIIWVFGLFVSASEQGNGLGRALIAALEEKFPECERVELLTHRDAPALKFYDRLGFDQTGYIHLMKE